MTATTSHTAQERRGDDARHPVRTPGLLLGLGMGGFVDGIVLHQILQWHQMLSETDEYGGRNVEDLEINVMADGFFHAATWVLVALGLATLWRVARTGIIRRTWRSLLGWMLVGWGVFNPVEGVIDHHILQIHRVRPDAANPLAWDLGFLALGVLLVAGGWALQRHDQRRADPPVGGRGAVSRGER
jgi:uncharacterized membrane protein